MRPLRRITCVAAIALAGLARADEKLAAEAAREAMVPVRPGVPGTARFWNGEARQFVHVPSFDFATVRGATSYRFTVVGADGQERVFEAAEPWAALAPVWADLPVGTTRVKCQGMTEGRPIGPAGERTFHRGAVFDGRHGEPLVPYGESARVALASVVHEPFVEAWRQTGKPDASYPLYRYPSKIIGKVMSACAAYARLEPRPADAGEVLEIGRRAGDYLIRITPEDGPLAGMPPTYQRGDATERENDRWTWMMTPAEAGEGYLDLYEATKEEGYLSAARRIADRYVRLQLASGTWHAKVDNQTGATLSATELIPAEVIEFLTRFSAAEEGPTRVRDRAVAWMRGNPVRTFDWRAQFDDAKVRGAYQNLAKHEACMFAGYLFRSGAKEDVATAEELLAWAEDQFVVWGMPPASSGKFAKAEDWYVPSSVEQYAMFEPVSGSSAFMIMTYVQAYRTTGKAIYLAKAEALADTLTRAQSRYNGRYPTRLYKSHDRVYWVNSTVNCVRAMRMLAAVAEGGNAK